MQRAVIIVINEIHLVISFYEDIYWNVKEKTIRYKVMKRLSVGKCMGLLIGLLCISNCFSQTEWSLKKDRDGIKVYTGKLADSKFNAIRVHCKLNASLSSLAAILLQPEIQPEWVIATKTSKLVKRLANNHLYYYNIASLPWPLENRDMVIELMIHQDSITKKMMIYANAIDKVLPPVSGLERIPFSQATWEVTPVSANEIQIDYILKINPGGGIPPWVVNMFIAKAPYESFHNLSKIILEKRFQNQKFDFIKN